MWVLFSYFYLCSLHCWIHSSVATNSINIPLSYTFHCSDTKLYQLRSGVSQSTSVKYILYWQDNENYDSMKFWLQQKVQWQFFLLIAESSLPFLSIISAEQSSDSIYKSLQIIPLNGNSINNIFTIQQAHLKMDLMF